MKNLLSIALFAFFSLSAIADDLGKKTYDMACQSCHAPKLSKSIKAPAAFDKKVWDLRFKQAKKAVKENSSKFKTPTDYLLAHVKMGKGLMHHGGLCNEAEVANKDCSDQAFIDAIHYMSQR